MRKSYHFETRKNNRGISDHFIELVLEYGDTIGDRVILGKKKEEMLVSEVKRLEKRLKKICDKNEIVVVMDGDTYITTYPLHIKNESYQKCIGNYNDNV